MANLRTTDYKGFNYASGSSNGDGGGLFLYSGSMVLNSAGTYTSYSGVGMELVGHSESYLRFQSSTSLSPGAIDIRAEQFYVGTPSTQFISGSGNSIEISSSNFHLKPDGKLIIGGDTTINADLSVDQLFVPAGRVASNAKAYISSSGESKFVGDGTGGYIVDFSLTGTQIAGFSISSAAISSSNNKLTLKSNGEITASAGSIGGWTIDNKRISTPGFEIGSSIRPYALSSSTFNVDHDGVMTASAGLIGGYTIGANKLTTTGFEIGDSSQTYALSSSKFNVDHDGLMTASAGLIGGWAIGATQLTGDQMVIRNDGTIESAGFVSNVPGSGFRLSAADGGFLEVENARIRGTLSTAVFEKETVNAVGGQLYVANATTLTGSGQLDNDEAESGIHRSTDETMSVANVTGFAVGEILSAKKIDNTGFNTEYILVNSSSRHDSDSDSDYSGNIYVTRGHGLGVPGDSGSLGNSPGVAQSYSGSQVIVSTGKEGTGFIRLNANPNDQATPYIQIVERTGSGIYDLELKAQLGDLSGISSAKLFGEADPGFGLFSENVFLTGGIVANTGSIGGIHMKNNKLYIGTGTYSNANTPFYVDNAGQFSLKDKLTWDGSTLSVKGAITIEAGSTSAIDFGADAAASASLAQSTANTATGSAATAQSTANTATGSAATAQSTANAATSSAASAQSTANAATSSAASAQTAIDAMESQLVLTSTGMDISSSGQSPDFGLAHFGTTTQFYDGVVGQNVKLQLNASGVKAYGNNANTYANVSSAGLDIVEGTVNVANFGSTMRVGVDATDKSAMRVDGDGTVTIGTSTTSSVRISGSGDFYLGGSAETAGLTWNASANVLTLAGESNGFNTIFYEDFSTYAAITDMTSSGNNPKTDGTGDGWRIIAGASAPRSFTTSEGHIKGTRALHIGDGIESDTDTWMSSNQLIPLNPSALYELEIRIKANKIGSSAGAYIGIIGYALDGTTLVNGYGADSTSNQHYIVLSNTDIGDTDWTVYKGYIKGRAASSNGGIHNNITDPATFHTDVEYIAPMLIVNYTNTSIATTDIDYVRISEYQSGGGSTKISGDSISTGKLRSNNLTTSVGSEFDLNAGTIKLGGNGADPNFAVDASGNVTASNANFDGYAIARSLRQKTVTINVDNAHLYISAMSHTDPTDTIAPWNSSIEIDFMLTITSQLVLDGTLGGEITSHVILDINLTQKDLNLLTSAQFVEDDGSTLWGSKRRINVGGSGDYAIGENISGTHYISRQVFNLDGEITLPTSGVGYGLIGASYMQLGALRAIIPPPTVPGESKVPVTIDIAPGKDVEFFIPIGTTATNTPGGFSVMRSSIASQVSIGQQLKHTGE